MTAFAAAVAPRTPIAPRPTQWRAPAPTSPTPHAAAASVGARPGPPATAIGPAVGRGPKTAPRAVATPHEPIRPRPADPDPPRRVAPRLIASAPGVVLIVIPRVPRIAPKPYTPPGRAVGPWRRISAAKRYAVITLLLYPRADRALPDLLPPAVWPLLGARAARGGIRNAPGVAGVASPHPVPGAAAAAVARPPEGAAAGEGA